MISRSIISKSKTLFFNTSKTSAVYYNHYTTKTDKRIINNNTFINQNNNNKSIFNNKYKYISNKCITISTVSNNNNNRCSYSSDNNNNTEKKENLSEEQSVFQKLFANNGSEEPKSNSIFVQTETTPNPDSLKFIPGVAVLDGNRIIDFPDYKSSQISPLANAIFKLDGVNRVFFSSTFISVNKFPEAEWGLLKPQIFGTIIDFYNSGKPILLEDNLEAENSDTAILPEDDEVVAMIKELIETRIRPTVLEDGGNIQYMGFTDGIVMVKLQGTCSSCSSSQATLKGGIERMLMHWISEVRGVIAVSDDELDKLNLDYFNTVDQKVEKGSEEDSAQQQKKE
eukprot:gene2088-2575_t